MVNELLEIQKLLMIRSALRLKKERKRRCEAAGLSERCEQLAPVPNEAWCDLALSPAARFSSGLVGDGMGWRGRERHWLRETERTKSVKIPPFPPQQPHIMNAGQKSVRRFAANNGESHPMPYHLPPVHHQLTHPYQHTCRAKAYAPLA